MQNRIDKIKEIIENNRISKVKPIDIVKSDTDWVSEDISNKRYSICQSCPELIKLTKQCKKCGCFMAVKTKLSLAECPIGKW
jgi:uncharacterized secreted protein with C-terminal beta-propeller domain